ncbi:hypothetical protein KKF82_05855 [Patescibacteria group bacterium]|nr:hypothetical protein [Patescibacteria group bacterium]
MRSFFSILTIILVVCGFIFPLLWIGAVICLVLAIGSAPPGLRADGKKKSGGLLGSLLDAVIVKNNQMRMRKKNKS